MKFLNWGLIDYKEALERQMNLVEEVSNGGEDAIVFCSHPPVVTLGRSSKPEDLQGWGGEVIETSRGGRATYHGPSQLVIYLIVHLAKPDRTNLKAKDVHAFLKAIEDVLVLSLKEIGVVAEGGLQRNKKQSDLSHTGVWVGERKLASIGIGVKKWVTYHGAAVNLTQDDKAFSGISPCGFQKSTMSSLQIFSENFDKKNLISIIKNNCEKIFT